MVNSKLVLSLALASSALATAGGISAPPTAFKPDGSQLTCQEQFDMCSTRPNTVKPVCDRELEACKKAKRGEVEPAQCVNGFNACVTKPGSIKAACQLTRSLCKECVAKDNECRTKPGAMMAACDGQLQGCLQKAEQGKRATKRDDRDAPAKCEEELNECRTKPGANMAACTAEHKECMNDDSDDSDDATTPSADPTTPPKSTATSVEDCENEYNECRTAPGANMAACKSAQAVCIHSHQGLGPAQPVKPEPTAAPSDCEAEFNKCRTAPGANMAACKGAQTECEAGAPKAPGSGSGLVKAPSPSASSSVTPTSAPPVSTSYPASAASRMGQFSSSFLAVFCVAIGFF